VVDELLGIARRAAARKAALRKEANARIADAVEIRDVGEWKTAFPDDA
jgi:hypothetical protein